MTFVLRENVDGHRLAGSIPSAFRAALPAGLPTAGLYTVLLFHADVIHSREVAKALAKTQTDHVLVAVAKGFTEESRALLIERGAVIVSLGDFFWTDASYLAIKRR